MALNLGSVQPPPASGKPARKSPGRKTASKVTAAELDALTKTRAETLAGLMQLGGGLALMAGATHDGAAVAKHAEPIAEEWAKVARDQPQVAQVLDALGKVGPYGAALMVTVPLVLQILVNHGRVPVEAVAKLGVVPPENLIMELETKAAQEAAAFAREQADAKKAHDEAMAELREAQESVPE